MAATQYHLWGGDLPCIHFRPCPGALVVFSSDRQRRWTAYHSLQLSKSDLRRFGDEFAAREPTWAFMVSNGADQVLLMPNAGKIYFEWHAAGSGSGLYMEVTEGQAIEMSKEFWRYEQHRIPEPRTKKKARIQPIGKALTWEATACTFHIQPPPPPRVTRRVHK